mgnify:CR=1 FL=1
MDKNEMNLAESKAITDVFNSVSYLIQTMRTDRSAREKYQHLMEVVREDMGNLRGNFPWLFDEAIPKLTYKPDTGLTMLKEPVKDTLTNMTERIDKMTERMSQVHDKLKELQQKTKNKKKTLN